MSTASPTPARKRRWPQFSLRGLLVLVTLTAIYFHSWELTKRHAKAAGGKSPMPFIVSREKSWQIQEGSKTIFFDTVEVYRVWFFGWERRLPNWLQPDPWGDEPDR